MAVLQYHVYDWSPELAVFRIEGRGPGERWTQAGWRYDRDFQANLVNGETSIISEQQAIERYGAHTEVAYPAKG